MSDARLTIKFAGPLVTIQDSGRVGHLRYGVPASGPMDRIAFAAANAALGNSHGQTAIEISLGGLVLECREGAVSIAIAGGDFTIEHAGIKTSSWTVLTLKQSERLAIRGGKRGSWAYLAFAGELKAKTWLGHTASLSTSKFGGGALQNGQEILIKQSGIREDREGEFRKPGFLNQDRPLRVVMGPQDKWFQQETIDTFLNSKYAVSDSYDRMGMRLSGAPLPLNGALSIPSEPIIRGSIQVSGEGVPTILLADHQTTGGYPKIATVISPDTDRLVQLRSRDTLEFQSIKKDEAIKIARQFSAELADYLVDIATPKGTLIQRLSSENLISGAVCD